MSYESRLMAELDELDDRLFLAGLVSKLRRYEV